jgi:ribosome assembly protein YihI (activator of Der GTPase)
MNREEAITMLEQHIARLERVSESTLGKEDQQFTQDAIDAAKELLERVKAGDEAAIQEVCDLLESGLGT